MAKVCDIVVPAWKAKALFEALGVVSCIVAAIAASLSLLAAGSIAALPLMYAVVSLGFLYLSSQEAGGDREFSRWVSVGAASTAVSSAWVGHLARTLSVSSLGVFLDQLLVALVPGAIATFVMFGLVAIGRSVYATAARRHRSRAGANIA